MGAAIVIGGIILYGIVLIFLSLTNQNYRQFGFGYFGFVIIAGLILGLLDGFGLGSILMIITGFLGALIMFGIRRTENK